MGSVVDRVEWPTVHSNGTYFRGHNALPLLQGCVSGRIHKVFSYVKLPLVAKMSAADALVDTLKSCMFPTIALLAESCP